MASELCMASLTSIVVNFISSSKITSLENDPPYVNVFLDSMQLTVFAYSLGCQLIRFSAIYTRICVFSQSPSLRSQEYLETV